MPTAIINGKTVVIPKGHEVIEINGEQKIVSAGEAKKLMKALKQVAAAAVAAPAAAGGGGGAAPVAVPKRDLRSNAEKVQDANLAEIDAAAAKNPVKGLWSYYRYDTRFYKVLEVDGATAKVCRLQRKNVKKDKLAAFLAEHPDAEITESEFVRIRKILPQPNFGVWACPHDEVEVVFTAYSEVGISKGLLKEDGKRVALRDLKAGVIVASHMEVASMRKTVFHRSPEGGFYRDEIVNESTDRIFAVVPEDRYEAYEVAHDVKLE
jgi:hypothetical protein